MNATPTPFPFNTDEAQVHAYQLPELLCMHDGRPVITLAQWVRERRPELLELFARHVYGVSPAQPRVAVRYEVTDEQNVEKPVAMLRRQVTAHFSHQGQQRSVAMLICLPASSLGPVPVFVGLNFHGNHTVLNDPAIALPAGWVRNLDQAGVTDHRASERGRGAFASRWDIPAIINNGYGLVTAYYGDIFPDHAQGHAQSIMSLFTSTPSQQDAHAWGAIGAWAWGLSRMLDYIQTSPEMDGTRAIAFGHSRLGKTALWAGATDERFAMAISNNSGCGGASISRRNFGESVERINNTFPHWFCKAFHDYGGREATLPVDQHMLIALMAPRPAYIASAQDDLWADPRGEFLASQHALPAYHLHGVDQPILRNMPPIHEPVGKHVRYHIRAGAHDVTAYDWQEYIRFANERLGG